MRSEIDNLGKKATDKVTGFTGTVICVLHYVTGCIQYELQPKVKDGKIPDSKWIDAERLGFGKQKVENPYLKEDKKITGGPERGPL